ncbi:MAG: hypothetical protein MUC89_05940 [Acetobacteraceae bacterium]|jgi:hypothetical protein|nr:hypothetical protein [Acetobacteraceae bacterium]
MTRHLLHQDRRSALTPLLPAGWDEARAAEALSALAGRALGAEWAGLFPRPAVDGEMISWHAEGGSLRRYTELSAEERSALRDSLGQAFSDLRRAAEREGGALLPVLAAAREIPAWDFAAALDGRPVLAAWGFAAAGAPPRGLIAALDDGIPASPPSRFPTGAVAATAGSLALLAVLATLLLPWWGWVATPAMPSCRADPAGLAALQGLFGEERREAELAAELGRLQGELGLKQAECPIRELPPEPPPPPPPQRPPPPPPRPEPPPVRPPDAQPCDVETRSGGRGVTRTRHYLGNRPGQVTLTYNTRIEPDQIDVYYRGRLVSSTYRPVSGRGTITFPYQPTGGGPEANTVEVVVTGYGLTTQWSYAIGCPR